MLSRQLVGGTRQGSCLCQRSALSNTLAGPLSLLRTQSLSCQHREENRLPQPLNPLLRGAQGSLRTRVRARPRQAAASREYADPLSETRERPPRLAASHAIFASRREANPSPCPLPVAEDYAPSPRRQPGLHPSSSRLQGSPARRAHLAPGIFSANQQPQGHAQAPLRFDAQAPQRLS